LHDRRFAEDTGATPKKRLMQIARWHTGHGTPARYILGRIAGINEQRLKQLVEKGDVEAIIKDVSSN
jgi:hypothetical protein